MTNWWDRGKRKEVLKSCKDPLDPPVKLGNGLMRYWVACSSDKSIFSKWSLGKQNHSLRWADEWIIFVQIEYTVYSRGFETNRLQFSQKNDFEVCFHNEFIDQNCETEIDRVIEYWIEENYDDKKKKLLWN